MSAQRPSLYVGSRGLIAAWHGPLGPSIAVFESWSRERPRFARTLGHPGADLPVTPAIWVTGDLVVAAWCEEEGAKVATVSLADGALGAASVAAPGARAVALGGGRGGATLFVADAEGLLAVALDRAGTPGPAQRVVAERRAGARLSATRSGDAGLLVHLHAGADGWGTVAARDGEDPVAVKHPEQRYASVHVAAAGTRAACVLERADREVRLAMLGPNGKVIERPHPVFPVGAPPLRSPQVAWMDDDWVVLAHDVETDALRVQPLSKRIEPFTLPRCAGPFAAAYYGRHLFALEVEPSPDGGALSLWRCRRDGSEPQQRRLEVALEDRAERRVRVEARGMLDRLADRMRHARGYRDVVRSAELTPDGGTLRIDDARGRLRLRVAPRAEAVEVEVTSALGEDPTLPDAPSSLIRLARWVRTRISPAARAEEAEERRWAESLAEAIGAALREVQRAGSTLLLVLVLDELPAAEALERWLRRLRDEQVARRSPDEAARAPEEAG